jgi:salicylate hydroxylase
LRDRVLRDIFFIYLHPLYIAKSLYKTSINSIFHFLNQILLLNCHKIINRMSSTSRKVIIIGCGISGPIVALLLKQKGYNPVVLEKVRELGDAGSGLLLFPNGFKVLSLLNLSSEITNSTPNLQSLLDMSWDGTKIGGTALPSTWKEKYGQPACGVKRSILNLALKSALKEASIQLIEGWKLSSIHESTDTVTAISTDGREQTGSFLIGCDGIRSKTRSILLAQHSITEAEPTFTGLTQIAGISPTPPSLLSQNKNPAMLNFYGPDAHLITYPSYPVEAGMTGWAITQRSLTSDIETWQQMSKDELVSYKKELGIDFGGWCDQVTDLISGAEKIIKYGLYDRAALAPEHWLSKGARCVLIGDAAHPTSPHLGQGANQALEDCWVLADLLPDVGGREKGIGSQILRVAFENFAGVRAPRTEMLVRGARAQGERRVVGGGEEGRRRDEGLRMGWKDIRALEKKWDALLSGPF